MDSYKALTLAKAVYSKTDHGAGRYFYPNGLNPSMIKPGWQPKTPESSSPSFESHLLHLPFVVLRTCATWKRCTSLDTDDQPTTHSRDVWTVRITTPSEQKLQKDLRLGHEYPGSPPVLQCLPRLKTT